MPLGRQGIVLIASVMLIIFASVAVLSVTVFIVQRLQSHDAQQRNIKCVYNAQAGIHSSIYFYRFKDISANGYFSLGKTNIDANSYFVLGATDADLLMVNTSTAAIGGAGNIDLLNLSMQNAVNSKDIFIDRLTVAWDNSRRLRRISIDGRVVWRGNLSSPADVNLSPDFKLNTLPKIYLIDYLRFNGNMNNVTAITIRFRMRDGSVRTLKVYPASPNYNFTVKSTGKTVSSNIYKTIQADYNALTAKITNYGETNTEINP